METRQVVIALCIVISFSVPAKAADPWSKQDIALEAAWIGLNFVDWAQTRWMAKNDWYFDGQRHKELNPLFFEKRPNTFKVDTYFAVGTLLHVGVTHILPSKYRPYWQGVTIMTTGYCVGKNAHIGAGLNFSF